MHKGKLIAGVILVFIVGALAGSLGTGLYIKHRILAFAPGGPKPHVRKELLTKRLARKLDLTPSQRAEIDKILDESHRRIMGVRRDYLPEIKKINDSGLARMMEKLTPEQKVKLEELRRRLEERHTRAYIRSMGRDRRAEETMPILRKRLKLTEDQMRAVTPIVEKGIAERRRIFSDYEEQKRPDPSQLKQDLKSLDGSIEKRLEEILSKEQMDGYRDLQRPEHDVHPRNLQPGGPPSP